MLHIVPLGDRHEGGAAGVSFQFSGCNELKIDVIWCVKPILVQTNFKPTKDECLLFKVSLGHILRKQGWHNQEPNLCCHLERLSSGAASLPEKDGMKLWTNTFKQSHPQDFYVIGVRANIVEPKKCAYIRWNSLWVLLQRRPLIHCHWSNFGGLWMPAFIRAPGALFQALTETSFSQI